MQVLCYPLAPEGEHPPPPRHPRSFDSVSTTAEESVPQATQPISPPLALVPAPVKFVGFDNALPRRCLAQLQHVFRPQAPFWKEHEYDAIGTNCSRKVGYFSYLYEFKDRRAGNCVESVIDFIFEKARTDFPDEAAKATVGTS